MNSRISSAAPGLAKGSMLPLRLLAVCLGGALGTYAADTRATEPAERQGPSGVTVQPCRPERVAKSTEDMLPCAARSARPLAQPAADSLFDASGSSPGVDEQAQVIAASGVAAGANALVLADGGSALGAGATSNAAYATALGYAATASGKNSLAGGRQAEAKGASSVALGGTAEGPNGEPVEDGRVDPVLLNTYAGDRSVAVGASSRALGFGGIAVGFAALAQQDLNIAIGTGAFAKGDT